jgi:hypothetical protein
MLQQIRHSHRQRFESAFENQVLITFNSTAFSNVYDFFMIGLQITIFGGNILAERSI